MPAPDAILREKVPARWLHSLRQRLPFVSPRQSNKGGAAAILVYHRITGAGSDPLGLAVSPDHLGEQLAVLEQRFNPVSLAELAEMVVDGTIRDRSVVVTFDDGYDSVLHAAKPLLEGHGVPATAFVASGYVGSSRDFWWEELERIVFEGDLAAPLSVPYNGGTFAWEPRRGLARMLRRHRIAGPLGTYVGLMKQLRLLPADARAELMDALRASARIPANGSTPGRRPLNADELRALARGNLVEIGAHTVSHPVLAKLADPEQHREIVESKDALEDVLCAPVTSFAYPYGGREDFLPATTEAVRRAGFRRACANVPALVRRDTGLWRLPRFVVGDWDAGTFERRLERWFAGGLS